MAETGLQHRDSGFYPSARTFLPSQCHFIFSVYFVIIVIQAGPPSLMVHMLMAVVTVAGLTHDLSACLFYKGTFSIIKSASMEP